MSNDDSTRFVAANKKCESPSAADKRKFGESNALPNVMGLIGAVIVVLALTVTLGFYGGALAPQKLLLLGLLYVCLFSTGAYYAFTKYHAPTLSGLCAFVAVCAVPILVYGVQEMARTLMSTEILDKVRHIGLYDSFVPMGLITIGASVAACCCLPFPFPLLALPHALALCLLGLELYSDWGPEPRQFSQFATFWGLVLILYAHGCEIQFKSPDYARYFYVIGALLFWVSLSEQALVEDLNRLLYVGINVSLVMLAVPLQRRVFRWLGFLGLALYFGVESRKLSLLTFTFTASLVGIALMLFSARFGSADETTAEEEKKEPAITNAAELSGGS